MTTNSKSTMWEELEINDCQILDVQFSYADSKHIDAIRLKHPSLKRARWFSESKKGNFYSRYTGSESEMYADGYIIKDPYGEVQPFLRIWLTKRAVDVKPLSS